MVSHLDRDTPLCNNWQVLILLNHAYPHVVWFLDTELYQLGFSITAEYDKF